MNKVEQDVVARIERTETLLAKLKEVRKLAQQKKYIFQVTLISAWSDYGEKNGIGRGKTIPEATHNARQNFMELNNRKDVQASHKTVRVIFENGFELSPHILG